MAYSSASKKAAIARANKLYLEESNTPGVITTIKSRSGLVFISSRGRNVADVKPISRFK